MGGAELKTDSLRRWMMYSKDAYESGRLFLTADQKQAVEEGKQFAQRAYPDVWARDAVLVQRIRSFLAQNFHWHRQLAKRGEDLAVVQTLQSMIRGESIVLVAEQSYSGSAIGAPTPMADKLPNFRESLMAGYRMSYDAASDYIERYNAIVDRVQADAIRYAKGAVPTLVDDADVSSPPGDAQPFEYGKESPAGEVIELAGSEGMPRNNQAQNAQFHAVVKALGLNRSQARQLHEEISRQGLGYHEILERGRDLFGSGDD